MATTRFNWKSIGLGDRLVARPDRLEEGLVVPPKDVVEPEPDEEFVEEPDLTEPDPIQDVDPQIRLGAMRQINNQMAQAQAGTIQQLMDEQSRQNQQVLDRLQRMRTPAPRHNLRDKYKPYNYINKDWWLYDEAQETKTPPKLERMIILNGVKTGGTVKATDKCKPATEYVGDNKPTKRQRITMPSGRKGTVVGLGDNGRTVRIMVDGDRSPMLYPKNHLIFAKH